MRWGRLIVVEGSEDAILHAKNNSLFNTSRTMGNVTCTVLDEVMLGQFEWLVTHMPVDADGQPAFKGYQGGDQGLDATSTEKEPS